MVVVVVVYIISLPTFTLLCLPLLSGVVVDVVGFTTPDRCHLTSVVNMLWHIVLCSIH